MTLYSDPPPFEDFSVTKPTLLVSWWTTTFCTVIVLLRVAGRFVRSERLFTEDKTAALALIPLYVRMACVHVILVYGTNNVQLDSITLSDDEIHRRQIASGLVLLSRIMYAATLWIFKNTILEFLKRLNVNWERSYEYGLLFIRCALGATFIAVVISDLAECQPFSNYWQVTPDPGGQCRQGYAQLVTMAVCNIFTDLLLVIFPATIVIRSVLNTKRKVQLVMLFSMSLAVVAISVYRVPHIIWDQGNQRSRSLYASVELLFATAAANSLVLGSFVRDRGVKKPKFKYGSVAAGSMEPPASSASRRPTMNRHWGSDEDLVRDLGLGVQPELREMPDSPTSKPPTFMPAPTANGQDEIQSWNFAVQKRTSARSDDSLIPRDQLAPSSRSNSTATPRKVSFFDVGGLLEDDDSTTRRPSHVSGLDPLSPHSIPSPTVPASGSGQRRGSTAFLQDIGGLLGLPTTSHISSSAPVSNSRRNRAGTELEPIPQSTERVAPSSPDFPSPGTSEPVLIDVGGLLSDSKK